MDTAKAIPNALVLLLYSAAILFLSPFEFLRFSIMPKRSAQILFSAKFKNKSKKSQNSPPVKPKNLERRAREYLTQIEVKDLALAARELGRHGFRDFLLITVAYRHALRGSELVDLRWEQVQFRTAKLHQARFEKV